MKITKTIAAVAISASSAFALIGPGSVTKSYCLSVQDDSEGSLYAGNCDQTENNKILKKKILSNGCAVEQIVLTARKFGHNAKFDIQIRPCLPPNVVQL